MHFQPGLVFYDEDTEEEEEEEGQDEGQTDDATPAQAHGLTEERPESVLTDVTIDGLGDQDLSDMSGKLN